MTLTLATLALASVTPADRPPMQPVPGVRVPAVNAPNRDPLRPAPLLKLPVGSFRPAGWLGRALELQRDGLAGHLGEVSIWLTKDDNAWLKPDGKGKWGWEEVPYWLRGYARMAFILDDKRMLDESMVWINGVLSSQRGDGDFGPVVHRNGNRDLWAQMVMLQVLQAFHEKTGDARVVPFMTRYFRYQLSIPDGKFLQDYWENSRGGDNLASVYWLYNRTGEAFLLDLAAKIDRNTADWRQEGDLPNWHIVNIAQSFREPAEFFQQSGRPYDLEASYRAFRLPRERYGQVPGGMFGADENARPGFTDPHQGSETCSFVEQLWSNMLLTSITADPMWAANSEDVAFNSMPAAFTPDYRALRYLTCPNQAVADANNHAPGVQNEGPFFLMNPFNSRCCQHNHSSAWVNYAEHAWFGTLDGGLAAVLFAPGTLRAAVAGGEAEVETATHYPFEDTITFTIRKGPEGGFPIYLRVPAWCGEPSVEVNGGPAAKVAAGSPYIRVQQAWKPGDTLRLHLPMEVRLRVWKENKGAVSVDYGPLTFSLEIGERYRPVASDKTPMHDSAWQPGADPAKWPSHEILPTTAWNYGLLAPDAAAFEVQRRAWPANDDPFTNAGAPLVLKARGRRLPGWTLDEHGMAGVLPPSPVRSAEPLEPVTLVPMGGARLRISAFPLLNQ